MRENLARLIVLITGSLVIILSMVFARIQNQEKILAVETDHVAQGQQLFQQHGCARCHSIQDKGNQRNPLDGVTKKYTDKELRDWITGAQTLEGKMSQGIMNIKSKYQQLPKEEIDILIRYLEIE